MMISTILLIVNLISLIFKDVLILSWGTIILCYVIETGVYFIIVVVIAIITLVIGAGINN